MLLPRIHPFPLPGPKVFWRRLSDSQIFSCLNRTASKGRSLIYAFMSGKRDVDLRDAWHHKVTDVDMDFGRQEIVCLIILTCCFEKWQTTHNSICSSLDWWLQHRNKRGKLGDQLMTIVCHIEKIDLHF